VSSRQLSAILSFGRLVLGTLRDLAPIVAVVLFFQLLVLRQPLPNLGAVVVGLACVTLGLALFIRGLEMALFPIGESLANAFARKGSLGWLLLFAFGLGFGTTVAEPALIAVCEEAAEVMAAASGLSGDQAWRADRAGQLRYTVAFAVGAALVVGVLRALKGWPVQHLIIGIAYDSGGVTTSTITVPLVTALGVGLASVIKGRNPMIDGFGMIAFASLSPMIFVLVFGMVVLG
jgi:hypothetical protein